jgi:hypothetical protein
LGNYLLKRTDLFQPSMVVDYHRSRCYDSPQGYQAQERLEMSNSDYLLVLTPNELDTIRTALRAESDRCKRQGFEGLKTHTDNLRDKISNMMIEHTYNRLDNKSKV